MVKKLKLEESAQSGWHPLDVKMAIAFKRQEINAMLEHRANYDPEDHNICLALVHFRDGGSTALAAYSNDSAIHESLRLQLGLIPNLYAHLPPAARFGCNGMANAHTEPKLLNFLCGTLAARRDIYNRPLPKDPVCRTAVARQRQQATAYAQHLKGVEDIASVTLVTEIDCCPTCTKYSIERFESNFPGIDLFIIELGKKVKGNIPPSIPGVTVRKTHPGSA